MAALVRPFSNPSGEKLGPGWLDIVALHGVAARQPSHKMRDEKSVRVRLLNLGASFVVAWRCIIDPDAILGCVVAVGCTLAYWHWGQHLSANMSWNIVSLAVVFPISQGIGMGFKRREQALGEFGHLIGNMRAVWGAIHVWKIKREGEWARCIEALESDQQAAVGDLFEEFLAALVAYFDIARWGRARQLAGCGAQEQTELIGISHEQRLRVDSALGRIQRLVQHLKTLGLPGGEAHRLDQYVSKMGIAIERLCCLKEYRTPQAFRAFARVYILLIGALYGPYYLHLAKGSSLAERNVGAALVFACGVQLALSGLFNVMIGLEDPFARRGGRGQLDSVQVPEICEVARLQLLALQRQASEAWAAGGGGGATSEGGSRP